LIVSSHRPLFRSVPETERHAFLGAKKHAKNPSAADAFMEKLRRILRWKLRRYMALF